MLHVHVHPAFLQFIQHLAQPLDELEEGGK
jgi:hypothetical protein